MKVLFITRDLIQNAGWGRTSYETVQAVQKDKTISVSVAVEKLGGKEGCADTVVELVPSTSWYAIVKNIIRIIRVSRTYDVFHAMDLWPYGLYAYIASRLRKGSRYVINGIGTYSVAPLDKPFFGKIARYIYSHAAGVPCISEYTKQEIDRRVPQAKTVVALQGFTPMHSDEDMSDYLKDKFIQDSDYPVIITVGEAKPRKGQLYTAKAVASLRDVYPHIKYLIVCNRFAKSYMDQIKQINADADIGKNTIQLIQDAHTDAHLAALYKRADIFALNSVNSKEGHFEGFGLVILEANQFGVPAIGSLSCGIESAIHDGVNGLLCKQQDSVDIADKIKKIMELKKDKPDYWKQRSVDFCHTFSWDDTARIYINLYK